MAKTTTNKAMSLFDPSAMSAGFKMAYGAEMANVPHSNAAITASNVQFYSKLMEDQSKMFKSILEKDKKDEDERLEGIAERVKPFTDGTFSDETSAVYVDYLNALEKERKNKNLDKKGNEKQLANWTQRYNRFLNGAQANTTTLTSIVTMIENNQHIGKGMTKKDQRTLLAIGDLHTGKKTENLDAEQIIKTGGEVVYKVTDGSETYEVTEADLKQLVPIRDNNAEAEVKGLINAIVTKSAGMDKAIKDDVFKDQTSTYNEVLDIIKRAENPQNAYSTILDFKSNNMSQSFLEAMQDPKSTLFTTILETLGKTPGNLEDVLKKIDGDGDGVEGVTAADFTANKDNIGIFMDAIKKDADAGAPLAAMFIAQEVAPDEYERARANRKLGKTDTKYLPEHVVKKMEQENTIKNTAIALDPNAPKRTIPVTNGTIEFDMSKADKGKAILYKLNADVEGDSMYLTLQEYLDMAFGPFTINAQTDSRFKNVKIGNILPTEKIYTPK